MVRLNDALCQREDLTLVLPSVSDLDADIIRRIIAGSPLLVVIPGALPREVTSRMVDLLVGSEWGSYSSETGAGNIGTLKDFSTLFGCFGDTDCVDYFVQAGSRMAALNKLLRPFQNPAQTMLEHLDEVWPRGAELLSIEGRDCYVGLPRAFSDGGAAECHTDRADWDLPSDETTAINAQIAFNFCLSQTLGPDSGSLVLWPNVPDRADYDRNRRADVPYALDERRLPTPLVSYRPQPGDLYLFNAFRPHAVRAACGGGVRVTVSGFVDYSGDGQPLRLHS